MQDAQEGTSTSQQAGRGFASLKAKNPDRMKEIARKGGRAAHAKNPNTHKFTSAEGRVAGEKGGRAVAAKYGSEHFSKIGRIGGKKSSRKRQEEPKLEVPVTGVVVVSTAKSNAPEKIVLDKSEQGDRLNNLTGHEGHV